MCIDIKCFYYLFPQDGFVRCLSGHTFPEALQPTPSLPSSISLDDTLPCFVPFDAANNIAYSRQSHFTNTSK